MQKSLIYAFIAIVAVFSILFYTYAHTITYYNIESKLQEITKQYPSKHLEGIVILDSKVLGARFEKRINAESVEYVLQTSFKDKTLQITQDITQEARLLKFLGLALVFLNLILWVVVAVLLWQNKRNLNLELNAVITALNSLEMENLNTLVLPNKTPLTQALKVFLERVEAHYRIQKQLYSGIAHELKTPLAVIKAKCEVTLLKPRENVVYINALKENIESVNSAQASIKALFNLVNGEQKEKAKVVNIQSELESIAKDFVLLHKERKFNYILQTQGLEIPIKLIFLRQIIQNFLQNAFKFTSKDKMVCLKSYVKDGILKVEVLDEGDGISPNIDVFAPFKKSGEKEGIGLGLFLAKRAAKALGGEIKLENREDMQGAIATFALKI
ncbi:sensor histidine kinase [Helicobacter turcicus]|uniref:histidine kinase n=1 Tax=Helicobacter turcicus TaxID=2867412 RepID=A0ABS7JKG0_9HELI|nr:HAMP domain-containing sensor histidine kinase [Helicobacter turcicus]MBX7489877.1 HAMP domain-containing histidine kinase [Helicobacter turcicus]MBX7544737.1 HAMP domain-containing histidine kinase [Helicobacter turcicus]